MARTDPGDVWQADAAVAKSDVVQWARETDARSIYQSIEELEGASVAGAGTSVRMVQVAGYTNPGDLPAPMSLRYRATPATHDACWQSVDGAYWELVTEVVSPRHLGAAWDGSTDDTDAINAAAVYAREKLVPMRLPEGEGYAASTLYLGGVNVFGAGGPSNTAWVGTKTFIKSDANPMVSMCVDAATAQTFQHTLWQGWGLREGPGAPAAIELWDVASYGYRVGAWLGRGHLHVAATTDTPAETGNEGAGQIILRDMSFQEIGGWAVNCYNLFGKSLIENCMFRDAGCEAAATEGDPAAGGCINVSAGTVDLRIVNCHGFANSHTTLAWRGKGTFLRVGAAKADTDALNRKWQLTGNIKIDECHGEGFERPLDLRSCAGLQPGSLVANGGSGGEVRIGYPGNPADAIRGCMGYTRVVNADVLDVAGPNLDRGMIENGTPATGMAYRYWRGAHVRFAPQMALQQDSIVATGLTLTPEATPTDHPDLASLEDGTPWRPLLVTPSVPATPLSNELPKFGTSGGSLSGWTGTDISGDASGSVSVEPHYVELTKYRVEYSASLTAGDLMTAMVWWRCQGALGDVGMANMILEMQDGSSGVVISRAVGTGTNTGSLEFFRAFNFKVPSGGTVVFRISNSDGTAVRAWTPILVPGALAPLGEDPPALWPARGEMISTF
jgi:hypothetical protein